MALIKTETIKLKINMYKKMHDFFYNPCKRKILLGGRRCGKTISAIFYLIQACIKNKPDKQLEILWLDVVYSNIDNYYRKYWLPILQKLPICIWKYQKQSPKLTLNGHTITFRSIDNENALYGMSYDIIILNECSVLLETDGIIEDALLPMLFDRPNGELLLIGTPVTSAYMKYQELVRDIESNNKNNWYIERFTSYDNKFLNLEKVKEFEESMDPESASVQVYANFPNRNNFNFFYVFDRLKHVKSMSMPVNCYLSFDFNVSPLSVVVFTTAKDAIYIFDELIINKSDIKEFCLLIRQKWPNMHILQVTGDASGNNHSALVKNTNYYDIIERELNLKHNQVITPKSNPTHIDSRMLCNSFMQSAIFYIDPRCKKTIESIEKLSIDRDGKMIRGQYDHATDVVRYAIHCFHDNYLKGKLPSWTLSKI